MRKTTLLLIAAAIFPFAANAEISLKTVQSYPLTNTPVRFCTNGTMCYYCDANRIYNYVNIEMLKGEGTISDLRMSPTGSSFYALYDTRSNSSFINTKGSKSFKTDSVFGRLMLSGLNQTKPECFCFTDDASEIVVAGGDGRIHVFSILNNKFIEAKTLSGQAACTTIAVSPNKYYVASASGITITIYNYSSGQIRTKVQTTGRITKIIFSADGSLMYALCDDSCIHCFETVNFTETKSFAGLDRALSFDLTKDGKYLAVATSGKEITVINTYNYARQTIQLAKDGLTDLHFTTPRNGSEKLIYNTTGSLVLAELTGREINYSVVLKKELSTRLDSWTKRMPMESIEEYNLRVNDSTIISHSLFLQQQISTELAEKYFTLPEINLEGYDYSNHILPISLGEMPPIYLSVEPNDVLSFSEPDQLELKMPIFMLNTQDEFELVYVEVTNKTSGKQYVFDNRKMKALEFLTSNDQFVPLDLIQRSNMQEMKLDQIKDDILTESMSKSIISSHTKVNVRTKVAPDHDASGNSIFNYTVALDYSVDAAFSEREDYPSGHYLVEESGAAKALCQIISEAFQGDFKEYLKPGRKVLISLTGSSDAAQIRNAIKYDGVYGDFSDFPVYDNEVLCGITVNAKKGIKGNDELAFIRAVGLKEAVCKSVTELKDMDCTYKYNIHVSKEIGSEFRRVSVSFTFVNAF